MTIATKTSPVSGLTDEQQDFVEAIRDYQSRERRFGMTSAQVSESTRRND